MPHPVSRYSVREHPDFLPITYTGVCGKSASWSGKARRREGKEAANGREWTLFFRHRVVALPGDFA
jgi:hypothetical protein